ncbi:hypothetical protein KsCSTR_23340 [Candidatus Kuenenia stuttgartiensis]|nr:hypothetical protein KsCSTR_23340 [Candidatus Kuenenia stuttgartiensis]
MKWKYPCGNERDSKKLKYYDFPKNQIITLLFIITPLTLF